MLSEVLDELKTSFNLKKNHLLILNLLSGEECTADEICDRTGIPKGRIYNLLNELIRMRLIERKKGVPAIYSMETPDDKVLDFLRYSFNQDVKKQTKILSMLEEKTTLERVEIIRDNKTNDYGLIGLLSQASWLKTIHRDLSISWFIQPKEEEEFWKVREEVNKRRRAATTPNREISILKYRGYQDFYNEKPIEQIMTKEALIGYRDIIKDIYGETKVKKWVKDTLKGLEEHKNVKLFIIDAASSVFNTYISDKGVMSILVYKGEVSGIKIIGKRVVDLYEKSFEELKAKSRPIQDYVKEWV